MSAKTVFSAALVVTVLCFCAAQAQTQSAAQGPVSQDSGSPAPSVIPSDKEDKPATPTLPHHLSPYITYQCPECCGPIGGNGPIQYELYARAGWSFPVGGSNFSNTLQNGWEIAIGGRTLLFNTDMDAAWALDLGLNNIWNHGKNPNITFPIQQIPSPGTVGGTPQPGVLTITNVSIHALNRTFVNFGLGREWYPVGSANTDCTKWRVGVDLGGRYGSAKLELNEITHRTKVFEGIYLAVHSDLEVPCCSVVFLAGVRAEWAYTWSNILQSQNNADLSEVDLLLTAGVRF